jgi:hypothetical protein
MSKVEEVKKNNKFITSINSIEDSEYLSNSDEEYENAISRRDKDLREEACNEIYNSLIRFVTTRNNYHTIPICEYLTLKDVDKLLHDFGI